MFVGRDHQFDFETVASYHSHCNQWWGRDHLFSSFAIKEGKSGGRVEWTDANLSLRS